MNKKKLIGGFLIMAGLTIISEGWYKKLLPSSKPAVNIQQERTTFELEGLVNVYYNNETYSLQMDRLPDSKPDEGYITIKPK